MPDDSPEEVIEPDATAAQLGDLRAAEAEPDVRTVRQAVFGSPSPPLLHEVRSSRWMESWMMLSEMAEAEHAVEQIRGATQRIAGATGFLSFDVLRWILIGAQPELPRALLTVQRPGERLADGTVLGHTRAVIVANVPLTDAEMRHLAGRVRKVWQLEYPIIGDRDATVPRRRTPQVTAAQGEVLRFVEERGGPPRKRGKTKRTEGELTWDELAAAWAKEGHAPKLTAMGLYSRYQRAERNRKKLSAADERTPHEEG